MREASSAEAEALAQKMYARFAPEVPAVLDLARSHLDRAAATGTVSPRESTPVWDCLLLYLLVRHFNRQHAFEVGTYVGTTAVCMNEAARRNGGVCTTTDPIDYGFIPPYSGLRFIRGPAALGLQILRREGRGVDFAFFDWIPDDETVGLMLEVFTGDAILALHDYAYDVKGKMILEQLQRGYCPQRDGVWFWPGAEQWPVTPGGEKLINWDTAFFIPPSLLG